MADLSTQPQQATSSDCQGNCTIGGVLRDISQSGGPVVMTKEDQSRSGDDPKVQVHNGPENMPPSNVLVNEKSRLRTKLGDVSQRLPSERRGRNDKGKSNKPSQTNAAYTDAPEEGTKGPNGCTTKPPAGKPQVQATSSASSGRDASSRKPITALKESATDVASIPARLGSDGRLAASVPTLAGSASPALEAVEDGEHSPAVGRISSSRVHASLATMQASALTPIILAILATASMAGAAMTDLGGYLHDIAGTLYEQERWFWPQASYMAKQTELSSNDRGTLIDWLVKVQISRKLRRRTLYLTVNLVDRYLSMVVVTMQQLKLVGIAALFIAWKFEEVELPDLHDLFHITEGAYSQGDILRMEYAMLKALSFRIAVPTYAHFLDLVLSAWQCNAVQREFVQFLVELALLDVDMLRYLPSQLVLAGACLAKDLKCGEQAPKPAPGYVHGHADIPVASNVPVHASDVSLVCSTDEVPQDATCEGMDCTVIAGDDHVKPAANNFPAAVVGHIVNPTASNVPVYAPRASASCSSCEAARASTCAMEDASEFSVWDDFTQRVNSAPASSFRQASKLPDCAERVSMSWTICEDATAIASIAEECTEPAGWSGDTRMVATHEIVQQAARRSHLDQCKQDLLALLRKAPTSSLQVVREKYMSEKHHSVARLSFGAAERTSRTRVRI